MATVRSLAAALGANKLETAARRFSKTMASLLVPPATVRGMISLDRSKFTTLAEVPALRLGSGNMAKVMPALKKYILKLQNFKPVQNLADDSADNPRPGKIAFLDPGRVREFQDIDQDDRETLRLNNATELTKETITLSYENWRYDQIFKAVLPEGIEVPNAYSKVGHLVHLNLRESQLPHKNLIGQVLLDKVSHTRTVVNKLNTIDNTYRHFAMEVIAGEDDTLASVTENGCKYRFDFAKVYWNPRLSTEHQALVSFLKHDDVLYDVFAGVGPFAVPAARKGNRVMANDLNPESYKWLIENTKMNKTRGNIQAFNKDGRLFLEQDVREDILERRRRGAKGFEHIAMNLPAMAAEFLDVFRGWFSSDDVEIVADKPATVHLYCFVKLGRDEDPAILARQLVEEKLGCELSGESLVGVHHVRNVSPSKEMMRVSFLLTRDILGGERPPAAKKLKLDNLHVFVDDNVVGKDGKEQAAPQDQKCLQSCRSP